MYFMLWGFSNHYEAPGIFSFEKYRYVVLNTWYHVIEWEMFFIFVFYILLNDGYRK